MKTRTEYYGGHTIRLVEDEEIVEVQAVNSALPAEQLPPYEILRKLARVGVGERVGDRGPLLASVSLQEGKTSDYETLFGRDSIWCALILEDAHLAEATSLHWAKSQGQVKDVRTHEMPGSIAHEERDLDSEGIRSLIEAGMSFPDYGSIDAVPLWCRLTLEVIECNPRFVHKVVRHARDDNEFTILQALKRCVDLMDQQLASNDERLLEAEAFAGKYKAFPFWKDSPEAYAHFDGTLATPPVCSVEVMGYAYDAYDGMARLAAAQPALGLDGDTYSTKAKQIRATLLDYFWVTDSAGSYFALGTDRDPRTRSPRPIKVRASNMGHLLYSAVLAGRQYKPYRDAIAAALKSPTMKNWAGIRTLEAGAVRFSPREYHTGSVWPHDTFISAIGLLRNGYLEQGKQLLADVVASTALSAFEFLPGSESVEPALPDYSVRVRTRNVCGDSITRTKVKEPTHCQAWALVSGIRAERELERFAAEMRSDSKISEIGPCL